jgi:hypothetical protein
MAEVVARLAAEGLEDQLGKQVAIGLPDPADLARGFEGFIMQGVAHPGENHLVCGGLGETNP